MKTPSAPSAVPADALVAAYEELRRRFLNREQAPGLALLMRRGMREWLDACSFYVASPPTSVPTATPEDAAVLPQGVRAEVVLILAGMLLNGCREARP